MAYWPLDEFRSWAVKALAVVREVRASFVEPGDIDWRLKTAGAFEADGLDAPSLYDRMSALVAADRMEIVEG